jgi:hypothetical protein
MLKTLTAATVAAGLLGAGAAHASFVVSDTVPPAQSTVNVGSNNEFQSQLAGVGITSFLKGVSLGLTDPGTVTASYFGKDAAYQNQFLWGGTPVFTTSTAIHDTWGDAGKTFTTSAGSGVLNFSFCALTTSQCLTNQGNDAADGHPQHIGIAITNGGRTAWLMWDDGGGTPTADQDYNDMLVRLDVAAASVPEPATLGLLGMGLLGLGAAARRRRG